MSDFPVIENPAKLKVVELKEELDKRGLPVGGLKKDVRPFYNLVIPLAAPALVPSLAALMLISSS